MVRKMQLFWLIATEFWQQYTRKQWPNMLYVGHFYGQKVAFETIFISGTTMQIPDKLTDQQTYSMALFRSAIHPEFFDIEERIQVCHNDYEFEAWLYKGGHVLRFEFDGTCVTEVVTPDPEILPERGHITTMVCAGERDHEQEFGDRVTLITSMQMELLPDHLFGDSYKELVDFGKETQAKVICYNENGDHGASIMDVQRYNDQLHTQSYHLQSKHGLVLRTQSIFELKEESST